MPLDRGYLSITDPDAPIFERDCISCGHCQRSITVKPGSGTTVYLVFNRAAWAWEEEAGHFCRVCMRPVCPSCGHDGRCTPWERMLEASEAKDRLRRQILENFD
jgi:hypothetical protein